jgi:hypothetical protein
VRRHRPAAAGGALLAPALALALLALPRQAPASDDGGQAEAWTQQQIGARSEALGGAVAALVADPFAVQWNPALFGTMDQWHVSAFSALLPDTSSLEYAGYAAEAGPGADWGWGLDYAQQNTGGLEARSANTPGPDSIVPDSASLFRLGMGYWLPGHWLALGADLKLYSHALDGATANGFSEDLGALWRARSWLDLGLDLGDPLSVVTWSTGRGEALPVSARLGSVARALGGRLAFSADLAFSTAEDPQLHLGFEFWPWAGALALRAGVDNGQLAAGLGARATVFGTRVALDYAASTDSSGSGQLLNRLSLDLGFDL